MDEQYEYISVSEYAERVGKSAQTIRNWIAKGNVETVVFRRQGMKGILCKVKKEQ